MAPVTNPTAASEEPSEPTARPSGPTVADIEAAAARLEGVAVRTPLQLNERLSQRTGAFVWLKREDLQPVRSYKIRGAYNLTAATAAAVACSAWRVASALIASAVAVRAVSVSRTDWVSW